MSAVILSKSSEFKKRCMQAMKNMYPQGVNSAQQHRDVIKGYVCGWGDSLHEHKNLVALRAFVEDQETHRIATDPNWWPDNSWCWWA